MRRLEPSAPIMDLLRTGGLAGAFAASTFALGFGFVVHTLGGPGLASVAALLLAREALPRKPPVLADRIVARVMLFSDALVLAFLAVAAHRIHASEVGLVEAAPGIALLSVVLLTLASLVANVLVDWLKHTSAWIHRAAIAAILIVSGLVALAMSHGRVPLSYVLSALLGLAVGISAIERAARHHERGRELCRAVEGVMGADGWITFASGAPAIRHVDRVGALLCGPGDVVVTLGENARAPSYRVTAQQEIQDIHQGTLDANTHWARLEAASSDALALGALAVTSAPLAAALVTMS